MIVINKQKFLVELGKLLSFMEDNDRRNVLSAYSEMFDSIGDEQALLKALISPTKQAVMLSRCYDRSSGEPAYAAELERIRSEVLKAKPAPAVPAEVDIPVSTSDLEADLDARNRELEEEERAEEEAIAASVQEPSSDEPAPAKEVDAVSDEVPSGESLQAPEGFELLPEEPAPEMSAEEILASENEQSVEPLPEQEIFSVQTDNAAIIDLLEGKNSTAPVRKVRKARVFLLILFIILAVPVGITGIAVLLIPTALFVLLTAVVLFSCFALCAAALSGFAVIADFFVVLGSAVISLALGVLLVWIVIWFIFGVIPGWIRCLCSLGGRWCFKEVEVNG